jgi:ribosomal protein S18 acetylase RimI-like enzyme
MPDMLIKLYDLDDDWGFMAGQKDRGVTIRKPIGPEVDSVKDWVASNFGEGWAAETRIAIANRPRSCFAAIEKTQIIGFACYDATVLGYFGPLGVAESYRARGIGTSLLKACLLDMKLKGYGYAIAGDVKKPAFFQRAVGAIAIPDSSPGIYRNRISIDC